VDSTLDFRTAWRWLIPTGVSSVACFGIDTDEVAYLVEKLRGTVRIEHIGSMHPEELEEFDALCGKLGRWNQRRVLSSLTAAFPSVRVYSLLPRCNPRVLIPISSGRRPVLHALRLHRPGSLFARAGVAIAYVCAQLGWFAPLRGQVLFIAARNDAAPPMGTVASKLAADIGSDFALYLGTPDENRKTVVLPIGADAPRLIVKVAETPAAQALLANEAKVLRALAMSAIRLDVPSVRGLVNSNGTLSLHQEYRRRERPPSKLSDQAVLGFLGRLSNIDRQMVELETRLPSVPSLSKSSSASSVQAVVARLQELAKMGKNVWLHCSHGDFAPWNMSCSKQGLFVYDWEHASSGELAFSDAFYFVVAPAILIDNSPADIIVRNAIRFASELALRTDSPEADVHIYFALWLLARVSSSAFYVEMLDALNKNWV
jgi:hypothetical protein